MFPLRDHNPSRRTPYVTYALLAVNIAIFLAMVPLMTEPFALGQVYRTWGFVPAGSPTYTYLTTMFLHGGILHLAGNMLFLWIFGDNMEDEMGHVGFAAFYLASGVLATLAYQASTPFSPVPLVGASGAIAGVMGGYLLLFPKARVDVIFIFIVFFKIWPIPAWIVLGVWFGLQIFSEVLAPPGAAIAYWAHIGGFVVGLLLTLPVWIMRGATAYWTRTQFQPPHPPTQYRRTTIPVVPRRSWPKR